MMKNDTLSLKILFIISIQFLIYACTSASGIQAERNVENNFIILKNKDTIYGKKVRLSRGFNQIGTVKVVKVNGEKLLFGYDEIYQFHQHQKDGNFYVQEMVMLTRNDPKSYTFMDVRIHSGKVKLYEHDPTNWGNTTFVASDTYYGYVRTKKDFKAFKKKLEECNNFKEKYTNKNIQFSDTAIKEIIQFYNANCN